MADVGLQQSQNLSQQQTITPQMQQSLQILQAATLDLQQLVEQEMLENPVLEEDQAEPAAEDDLPEENLSEIEEDREREEREFAEEFEELARLDEDRRDELIQTQRSTGNSADAEEKHSHMLESITAPETLQEHLMRQLGLSSVPEEVRKATELLIGMVDDRGFLTSSVEDIALVERLPIDPLEDGLSLLHSFDPVGVGATDLEECLFLQLQRLGKVPSLESRIVEHHLEDLAKKRYPMLVKKLGISMEQLIKAADFISTLNPWPGSQFRPDQNTYVEPDITIKRDEGEWAIVLNNEHIPQLRISNTYKDIMAEGGSSTEARRYIRDKIRNGKFLIRSIYQRQETIEKIAREIVRHQEAFLLDGPGHLRPLTMATVADAIGVHETTVSRAVNGKYAITPQGVFELKYFFTTGYQTQDGESLSNTSVKNALLQLVKNEPAGKAYSDLELVELLKEQGIPIARRTVAKYRKELNILPSNMRRKF